MFGYERFVNIAAMAMPILRILSVTCPALIWNRFLLWLHALPSGKTQATASKTAWPKAAATVP